MAVLRNRQDLADARRLAVHLRKLETLIYIAEDQEHLYGKENHIMSDGKKRHLGLKQIDIVPENVEYSMKKFGLGMILQCIYLISLVF